MTVPQREGGYRKFHRGKGGYAKEVPHGVRPKALRVPQGEMKQILRVPQAEKGSRS